MHFELLVIYLGLHFQFYMTIFELVTKLKKKMKTIEIYDSKYELINVAINKFGKDKRVF